MTRSMKFIAHFCEGLQIRLQSCLDKYTRDSQKDGDERS